MRAPRYPPPYAVRETRDRVTRRRDSSTIAVIRKLGTVIRGRAGFGVDREEGAAVPGKRITPPNGGCMNTLQPVNGWRVSHALPSGPRTLQGPPPMPVKAELRLPSGDASATG